MSQFHNIPTTMLLRWLRDATALRDHAAMPEHTNDPAYPGKDWYRQNCKELTHEIERRTRLQLCRHASIETKCEHEECKQ